MGFKSEGWSSLEGPLSLSETPTFLFGSYTLMRVNRNLQVPMAPIRPKHYSSSHLQYKRLMISDFLVIRSKCCSLKIYLWALLLIAFFCQLDSSHLPLTPSKALDIFWTRSTRASNMGQYFPARNPARRSPSDPSLLSRTSDKSGPSTTEPAFIKSTWRIGWQTPTLMLACYFLGMKNSQAKLMVS